MTSPPLTPSAHVDTYARDHLPPAELWPELRFDLPELTYPRHLNCGTALLDEAVREGHGARIAIYSASGNWTYEMLLERSNRTAQVLVNRLGVVPGNRVLLRGPNCPMLVASWLAVMKAGAIAVTTVPMLRAKELAQIAAKAKIDHALCDSRFVDELAAARAHTGLLSHMLTWGNGDLEAAMHGQPDIFADVATAADDVCLLAFTSGTTGAPKATMHFHRDVLATADIVGRHLLETVPTDIYLGSPPLGFTFGLGALLVFPLRFRAATALVEQATAKSLLEAVQRFRATCLFTAPTMYRNLAALIEGCDLRSLERCVSAGEPLAKATSDTWHAASGIRLIDGIGATEMLHIFISAKGDAIRPGATGKPLPGYEAVLLDEHGVPLPPGSSGRLAVRGPTGCRYLDDSRQGEYVQQGWNLTGDQYFLDTDGYFWFQARTDDMIVSAGYNIAGPEVEGVLMAHAAVMEVAVVAAPDEQRGQIAKAFIVLRDGHSPTQDMARELQDFVKASIAPYKYPRAIEFVDQLPKTPTGKVQRFVLQQRAKTTT